MGGGIGGCSPWSLRGHKKRKRKGKKKKKNIKRKRKGKRKKEDVMREVPFRGGFREDADGSPPRIFYRDRAPDFV